MKMSSGMFNVMFSGMFAVLMMVIMATFALAVDPEAAKEVAAAPAVTQVDPTTFIQEILSKWYLVIMTVMAMASVLVNLTPTDTDNKILSALDSMLNILAGNFNVKGQVQKSQEVVPDKKD